MKEEYIEEIIEVQKPQKNSAPKETLSIGDIIRLIMTHLTLWVLLIAGATQIILPLIIDGYLPPPGHHPRSPALLDNNNNYTMGIGLLLIALYFILFILYLKKIRHNKPSKLESILAKISFWIGPATLTLGCILLIGYISMFALAMGFTAGPVSLIFSIVGGFVKAIFNYRSLYSFITSLALTTTTAFYISTSIFFYKITNSKTNISKKINIGNFHLASLILTVTLLALAGFVYYN